MRCASSNEDGVVTAPSSGRSSMMWRNPAAMLKPSSSSPGPKSSVATSTSQRKTVPLKSACLAFSPSELLRLSRTLLPSTSCANPATTVRRGPPGCLRRLSHRRAANWLALPAHYQCQVGVAERIGALASPYLFPLNYLPSDGATRDRALL